MPDYTITFGLIQTSFYAFALGAGLLLALAVLWLGLRSFHSAGQIADVGLAGVVGGLAGARLLHVGLYRAYFAENSEQIWRLSAGGLNWHGALIGGLLAMILFARWRGVARGPLLDALTLVLPLLAFVGWWGCGATHCAYGAEVANLSEHPSWLVWEAPDIFNLSAPRYATQPLGMALAAGLMLLALLLTYTGWFSGRRFWLLLVLLASGMFALAFLRGDYAETLAGLREDQWLDLLLLVISIALAIFQPGLTRVRSD